MAFKLVIALGNPGPEYAHTPHNVGRLFVEHLTSTLTDTTTGSLTHSAYVRYQHVLFAHPETYMNESGRAARELVRYFSIDPLHMVVVHDDADQHIGSFRMRRGGGAGGHRGVASIIEALGTDTFWRLKIGVRRPTLPDQPRLPAGDFVLRPFGRADEEVCYGAVFPAAAKSLWNVIENEMPSGPDRMSAMGSATS